MSYPFLEASIPTELLKRWLILRTQAPTVDMMDLVAEHCLAALPMHFVSHG